MSSFTPFHAKYRAHSPRLARHSGVDAISRSSGNARVDLNQDVTAWDDAAIVRRGEKLLEYARLLWPHPQTGSSGGERDA